MSNVFEYFNQFAQQAASQGMTSTEVNAERLRLFKQVVLPAIQQKGHKTSAELAQAAKIWNETTDSTLRDLGFLNAQGESWQEALDRRDMTRRGRAGGLSLAAGAAGSAANDIKTALHSMSLKTLGFAGRFANDLGENEQGSFLDNFANAMNEGATAVDKQGSIGYREALEQSPFDSVRSFGVAGTKAIPSILLPLLVGRAAGAGAGLLGAGAGIKAGVGGLAALGTGFTQNYGAVREGADQAMRESVTPDMLRAAEKSKPLFDKFEREGYKSGLTGEELTNYAYNKTIDQLGEDKATNWGLIMTALEPIAMGASTILARSGGGKYLGQEVAERAMGIGAGGAAMRAAVQNEGASGIRQALSLGSARADAGMVGRQSAEEAIQGGAEIYAGQDAAAELGGTPVDWSEVATNTAAEGILGGIMGGGMQMASGNSPSRVAKQQLAQLRQQHQAEGQIFAQLGAEAKAAEMAGDTEQFTDLVQQAEGQANSVRKIEDQMTGLGIPFQSILPQVDPTAAQPTPQPTVDPQQAALDEAIARSLASAGFGQQPQPQQPAATPAPTPAPADPFNDDLSAIGAPPATGLAGVAQRAQQNAPAPILEPMVIEPENTQADTDFIQQYVSNALSGNDAANSAMLRQKMAEGVNGNGLFMLVRKAERELKNAQQTATQGLPQATDLGQNAAPDTAIQAPPSQQQKPAKPSNDGQLLAEPEQQGFKAAIESWRANPRQSKFVDNLPPALAEKVKSGALQVVYGKAGSGLERMIVEKKESGNTRMFGVTDGNKTFMYVNDSTYQGDELWGKGSWYEVDIQQGSDGEMDIVQKAKPKPVKPVIPATPPVQGGKVELTENGQSVTIQPDGLVQPEPSIDGESDVKSEPSPSELLDRALDAMKGDTAWTDPVEGNGQTKWTKNIIERGLKTGTREIVVEYNNFGHAVSVTDTTSSTLRHQGTLDGGSADVFITRNNQTGRIESAVLQEGNNKSALPVDEGGSLSDKDFMQSLRDRGIVKDSEVSKANREFVLTPENLKDATHDQLIDHFGFLVRGVDSVENKMNLKMLVATLSRGIASNSKRSDMMHSIEGFTNGKLSQANKIHDLIDQAYGNGNETKPVSSEPVVAAQPSVSPATEVQPNDIGRASDGKPFATERPAQAKIKKDGLADSHEVVKLGASAFVIRPKQVDAPAPTQKPAITPIKIENSGMGYNNPKFEAEILTPARQAIAEGNSLPYKNGIQMVVMDNQDDGGTVIALDKDGQLVGSLDFVSVEEEDGTRHNPQVHVMPKYRRQGIASEMYRLAEEQGAKIPAFDQEGQARTEEGQALRESMDRKKKGLPPLPKPEPYRLKPVRVYRTKAGKVGAEIKETRDAKGRLTYAYMGEWGAGSVDADSMRQLEAEWQATKRGHTVDELDGDSESQPVSTPEPVQSTPESSTPKRDSLLIEIDDELDSALNDLAAVFKSQNGKMNSGIDPVVLGKVLAIGAKASALYLAKGAVKFSIWAENMLSGLSAKGVPEDMVKPYLKQLYLASKVGVDPAIRKAMDKEDDVLDFDWDAAQSPVDAAPEPRMDSPSTEQATAKVKSDSGLTHNIPSKLMDTSHKLGDVVQDFAAMNTTGVQSDHEYAKKLLQTIAKLNPDVQVHVVSDLNKIQDKAIRANLLAGGFYVPEQNTVFVYPKSEDWVGSALELVNHELVHSVTEKSIADGLVSKNDLEKLQDLRDKINDFRLLNHEELSENLKDRFAYILGKNPDHETLASGIAESEVREALNRIVGADGLQQLDAIFTEISTTQVAQNGTRNKGGSTRDGETAVLGDLPKTDEGSAAAAVPELSPRATGGQDANGGTRSGQANLPAGEAKSGRVTKPESRVEDSLFSLHQLIAQQYGYSVDATGKIFTPEGKDTNVKIKNPRATRLTIINDSGTLFTGANPDGLGKFLEDYWFAKKKFLKGSAGAEIPTESTVEPEPPAKSPESSQPTEEAEQSAAAQRQIASAEKFRAATQKLVDAYDEDGNVLFLVRRLRKTAANPDSNVSQMAGEVVEWFVENLGNRVIKAKRRDDAEAVAKAQRMIDAIARLDNTPEENIALVLPDIVRQVKQTAGTKKYHLELIEDELIDAVYSDLSSTESEQQINQDSVQAAINEAYKTIHLDAAGKKVLAENKRRLAESKAKSQPVESVPEPTPAPTAQPRSFNVDGTTTDGMSFGAGDVFQTTSGRMTTPYPKQKGRQYESQWLIDNAIAEAESRDDDYNATIFRNMRPTTGKTDRGTLTGGDYSLIQTYLFGEQPDVPRSIFKDGFASSEPQSVIVSEPAKPDPVAAMRAGKMRVHLNQPIKTADGDVTTIGKLIDLKISKGGRPVEISKRDPAAEKRLMSEFESLVRNAPIGNSNHPDTIRLNELKAMRKDPSQFRDGEFIVKTPDYRLKSADGTGDMVLTKTGFDYAQSVVANMSAPEPQSAPAQTKPTATQDNTSDAAQWKNLSAYSRTKILQSIGYSTAQGKVQAAAKDMVAKSFDDLPSATQKRLAQHFAEQAEAKKEADAFGETKKGYVGYIPKGSPEYAYHAESDQWNAAKPTEGSWSVGRSMDDFARGETLEDAYNEYVSKYVTMAEPTATQEAATPAQATKQFSPEQQAVIDGEAKKKEASKEFDQIIKLAADSVQKLRKADVYRVMENTPADIRNLMADYIASFHPEYKEELGESLRDLAKEASDKKSATKDLDQIIKRVTGKEYKDVAVSDAYLILELTPTDRRDAMVEHLSFLFESIPEFTKQIREAKAEIENVAEAYVPTMPLAKDFATGGEYQMALREWRKNRGNPEKSAYSKKMEDLNKRIKNAQARYNKPRPVGLVPPPIVAEALKNIKAELDDLIAQRDALLATKNQAEQSAQPEPEVKPSTPIVHIEGKQKEVGTANVVAKSLRKAQNDRTAAEYKVILDGLLADIDAAAKVAPAKLDASKDIPLRITFDVKGDGTFTVRNDKVSLAEFRAKVASSSGFRTVRAPSDKPKTESSSLSKASAITAIKSMLSEPKSDPYANQTAYEIAKNVGIEILAWQGKDGNVFADFVIKEVTLKGSPMLLVLDGSSKAKGKYKIVSKYGEMLTSVGAHSTEKQAMESLLEKEKLVDADKVATALAEAAERYKSVSQSDLRAKYEAKVYAEAGLTADNAPKFSRKDTSDTGSQPRNLFVAHNLSANNILAAADLGGLAAPSIAVARSDVSDFSSFGEVTLLADPTFLEDSKIRTFDADIYSPRQPRASYELNYSGFNRLRDSLEPQRLLGLRLPDFEDASGQNGKDEFSRSLGMQHKFLEEVGKAPKVKPLKTSTFVKSAAKLEGGRYQLEKNPAFIKIAEKYYADIMEKMAGAGRDRDFLQKAYYNEDGSLKESQISDFAWKVDSYKRSGGKDESQLAQDIRDKMKNQKLRNDFESWAAKQFDSLVVRKRMFDGYTNSGNRRYKPYTLETVVKAMTQQLQAGEQSFYGAGSVRSRYAKELKTLKAIQARRDSIITKQEMEEIKKQSDTVFMDAMEALKPFYKYDAKGFGYFDDAGSAIAEGQKGIREAFNLTPESRQIIGDLTEYLSNLGTEYFEAKAQRAVQFSEFNTAIVPKGMNKDALQVLRDAGLTIKTYDPKVEGDRTRVIAQQEKLLFSRNDDSRDEMNLLLDDLASFNIKDNNSVLDLDEYAIREDIINNLVDLAMKDEGFAGLALPAFGDFTVMITPSAKQSGAWQVTYFDGAMKPLSDAGTQTKEKALRRFFDDVRPEKVAVDDYGNRDVLRSVAVWHGSPYQFDRFSLEHMGTGEGVQAFGWGLYFAGNRDVAEHYKKVLSSMSYNLDSNRGLNRAQVLRIAKVLYPDSLGVFKVDTIASNIMAALEDGVPLSDVAMAYKNNPEALAAHNDLASRITGEGKAGKLYRVRLSPNESDFLSLDQPLSEQKQHFDKLKPILDSLSDSDELVRYEEKLDAQIEGWTGGDLINALYEAAMDDLLPYDNPKVAEALDEGDFPKAVSMYLHSLGIAGNRFLAQGGTGGGKGHQNYVLFDDSAAEIIEAYNSKDTQPQRPANAGQTIEQVRDLLTERFGADVVAKLEANGKLVIVQSVADLPEDLVGRSRGADGVFVPSTGVTFLIGDNLTPRTILPALLHETGGHFGFQTVMRPETYAAIMQQFDKMVEAGNPLAVRAKQRAERAESNPAIQRDEYLPYLITEASIAQDKKGGAYQAVKRLIDRAVAAVRAWAFDRWGVRLKLTPDDIVALAERMVRQAANPKGKPPTPPKGRSNADARNSINPSAKSLADVRKQHEGKPTWMKAPNGKPTNLTERQWLQVRTPEFKAWFGDWENDPANASKVVDANGEPMVVYHGTGEDFTVFNEGGSFFTDDPMIADGYANGEIVYETYLKIDNPYIVSAKGRKWDGLKNKRGTSTRDVVNNSRGTNDGVIFKNINDDPSDDENGQTSNVYVTFDPTQIKSATDNTGDFDGSNPDIRFSRRDTEFEDAPVTPANFESRMKRRIQEDFVQGHTFRKTGEFIKRWVGTPLHLSLTEPQFKPVFALIQERLNHVSAEASHAIEAAPEIMGRRETFADFRAEVKNATSMAFKGKYTQDMQAAAKVLFDGTLTDKKVFTDAELSAKGLTADQIKRYREMRAAINTSLDQSAKAHMSKVAMFEEVFTGEEIHRLHDQDLSVPLHREQLVAKINAALKGLDPIKQQDRQSIKRLKEALKKITDINGRLWKLKEEGYAPLMRFGNYDLRVTNKETGDTALYEMFETERERNRARDSLIESGVLGDKYEMTTKTKNPEEYKLFQEQGINPETFALFSKVAGLDDDASYQAYLKLATAPQSALRRLIHRKGIAGFSENTDRVMAAFVMSNARRSANMLYSQDIETSVMNIEDGELQGYAQRLVTYINNPVEEMAALRSFLFFMNMGFSLRYGLLNLTQPYIQTLPELTRYVPAGRATKIVTSSSAMAFKSMSDESAIPAEFQKDYQMLKRMGKLEPQNIWALQGRERGRSATTSAWDVVLHSSGIIAQLTETVNRRTAMIAALRTAKIMGDAKLKALGFNSPYEFAVNIIDTTQGVMNKGNRPQAARGMVGAPLFIFRTFSIQYVEQMIRMIKNPQYKGERDKLRKALLLLLLMLFGLAGATGLPFAKDLLDIFETGMAVSGNPVNLEREVQRTFGKELAEPILYGAVNGFLFDMHGSTSSGDLIPATRLLHPDTDISRGLLEVGGATGGLASKVLDSATMAARGQLGDAAINALPRFATSIGQGLQIANNGEYRTRYGNKLTDGTGLDAILKMLDMSPSGLAQQGRTRMLEREDLAIREDAKQGFRNRLIEAYEESDAAKVREIRADIKQWNTDNPLYPVEIDYNRSIKPAITRRNKTWQERTNVPSGMDWIKDLRPD